MVKPTQTVTQQQYTTEKQTSNHKTQKTQQQGKNYLKPLSMDKKKPQRRKREHGKKGTNPTHKHRPQKTRRSMWRTENNRRKNRRQNNRSNPTPNKKASCAGPKDSMRRRNSHLGQVGDAHPQAPHRHRRRRTGYAANHEGSCSRRGLREHRTHVTDYFTSSSPAYNVY